jgi:hypothetical protein
MDYLFNKYILAVGSIMTPLIAIILNHLQDSFYMLLALILFVSVDTSLGLYIAAKNGRLSSGKTGFWKIGDKLFCYFGLLITVYTVVFLSQAVPVIQNGLTADAFKYIIVFTYSIMYGREIFSIFESIDVLQPKLLPPYFKEKIAKIFNKKWDFQERPDNSLNK